MSYTLRYSSRALRDLKALPRQDQERIIRALEAITDNPFPFVHSLEGVSLSSFRAGGYRVLLAISREYILIFVIGVANRKNIYHRI